jgi:hypothetical protein
MNKSNLAIKGQFERQRERWLRQVASDRKLSLGERMVLTWLVMVYLNRKSFTAWPTIRDLGRGFAGVGQYNPEGPEEGEGPRASQNRLPQGVGAAVFQPRLHPDFSGSTRISFGGPRVSPG